VLREKLGELAAGKPVSGNDTVLVIGDSDLESASPRQSDQVSLWSSCKMRVKNGQDSS
jgi:hypothetical protein